MDRHLGLDSIRLPPRRVLTMVINQFFARSQVDYTLDVFELSSLQENVERVYTQRQGLETTAWAVCFNIMILLCLGAEPQASMSDPFLQPYLSTIQAAATNISTLMAPKLVNVQALMLLVRISSIGNL